VHPLLDRAQRQPFIHPNADRVLAAQCLQPYVISVGVLTRARDQHDRGVVMVSTAAAGSISSGPAKTAAPRLCPTAKTLTTSRPVTNRATSKSWMLQSRWKRPRVAAWNAPIRPTPARPIRMLRPY